MKNNTPQVGVGAIVFHNRRVLLIKRNQAPNAGQWAIPGGRINYGESLQQAAEREILEETGIIIRAGEPVFAFDVIQQDANQQCQLHYVVIDLAADYISGEPLAGDDAAEARWLSPEELADLPVNQLTLDLLKRQYQFG